MGFNPATTIANLFVTLPLLPVLLTALVTVEGEPTSGIISTYWGQNGPSPEISEGTLKEACETGRYGIINIAYLDKFGGGQEPAYNLANHCDRCEHGCTCIASDIEYCQKKGVKVMLAIGGAGNYTLTSSDDAKQVAEYLWNNFLEGQKSSNSSTGPFGDVVLDGIDFDVSEGTDMYWDDLARYLYEYGSGQGKQKVYLSALPQCPFPDYYLDKALDTGLFDYVAIQFYHNPSCEYSEGSNALRQSWDKWTANVNSPHLLLGIPASPEVGSGYVSPDVLKRDILPYIKNTAKYGGVMVWNRYWDVATNYSGQIISDIQACTCICPGNSYGRLPFASII